MDKKIKYVFETLKKLYPDPKTELRYSNDFQLMLAVILSAQTTDRQVNKVTDFLFEKIKNPEDIIKIGIGELEKMIKSVNYYKTKAKNIWKLAHLLPQSPIAKIFFDKKLSKKIFKKDNIISELVKLPGIGEKTAKVIAHVVCGQKVIAVDTHVHRVVNRLEIVNTQTPEQTSRSLEKIVPDRYKTFAHHALVLFGRYVCKAQNPNCQDCEFKKICKLCRNTKPLAVEYNICK